MGKYNYSCIKLTRIITLMILSIICITNHLQAVNQLEQNKKLTSPNYFELIMERVQDRHKTVDINKTDKSTEEYLAILQPNGAFSDIDYADRTRTKWFPVTHLDRLKSMIISYTSPSSKYYKNQSLYENILKMFSFWYDTNPTSTNWYFQQIGAPQRMGVLLILMRSGEQQLPKELEKKLLDRMEEIGGRPDQKGSLGTGANKLDIATHWIYRACLLEDADMLQFGVDQVYMPVFVTTGEGLQYDYSYQQHGKQLYIGGYGLVFIEGLASIASYMVDTPYQMPEDKLNMLSEFVRNTYLPSIRGKFIMYNIIGRSMTRQEILDHTPFVEVLEQMKFIDKNNQSSYQDAIDRIQGKQSPSFNLKARNKHYWTSDYTQHTRPSYTFDVRGSSIFTARNENGNQEGLKGYFLVDGATELVLSGDEFDAIFSVWDWTRIPGTTTPVVDSIPLPNAWQQPGVSVFSGGVSDGLYGVSTYLYNDTCYSLNTSAKKAWFMFDDEIVALGADIKSTSDYEINTTVNQTLLKSDVVIKPKTANSYTLSQEKEEVIRPEWIWQNNVGYYFPSSPEVNISNKKQYGSWQDINAFQPAGVDAINIFKLWMNHGTKPQNTDYEYILLPNISQQAIAKYSSKHIVVIENSSSVQAIWNKELDILGAVFYKPGNFSYKGIKLSTNTPCAIMIRNVSKNKAQLFVSDPSRVKEKIDIEVKLPSIKQTQTIEFLLPNGKSPYAGATLSCELDKDTSEQIVVYKSDMN